jgi:hypothetical protein
VLRRRLRLNRRSEDIDGPAEYRVLLSPIRPPLSVRRDPLFLALTVSFGALLGFSGNRATSLSPLEPWRC